MKPALIVMAGLVPAISRGTLPLQMAGTGPAMTMKVTRNANRVSCWRSEATPIPFRTAMEIAASLRS